VTGEGTVTTMASPAPMERGECDNVGAVAVPSDAAQVHGRARVCTSVVARVSHLIVVQAAFEAERSRLLEEITSSLGDAVSSFKNLNDTLEHAVEVVRVQ